MKSAIELPIWDRAWITEASSPSDLFDTDPEETEYDSLSADEPTRDFFSRYEKSLQELPSIGAERARELGTIIQAGKGAAEAIKILKEHHLASDDKIKRLTQLANAAAEAKAELIEGNIRFAAHIARLTMGLAPGGALVSNGEYTFRGGRNSNLAKLSDELLPLQDRIQIAIESLYKAADKYDPDKGAFTTFAIFDIESAIEDAIEADTSVHIKKPHPSDIRVKNRVAEKLAQELGRQPTKAELADGLNVSSEKLDNTLRLEVMADVGSVEALLEDPSTESLVELAEPIADNITPDADYYDQIDAEMIADTVLSQLTQRERSVLAMRMGMLAGRAATLDEVAGVFDVSRERIRVIQKESLKKLRSHPALHGYSQWHRY